MKIRRVLIMLLSLVSLWLVPSVAVAVPPAAPTLIAPASGASVLVPFQISWSAVSDPGIVAYNWQISNSSTFSPLLQGDSTSGPTQDTISGLPTGTYFWRVQAVNSGFEQGAWSASRSFTVTGASAASPAAPVLDPPVGYSTFHPWETMRFNWSAVPDAASYVFEASTDRNFPAGSIRMNNLPTPTDSFAIANPEGNYFGRAQAVNADGIASMPSNVIEFSVFYNNPVPPPPVPLEPANDVTLTLPFTLKWAHSINPQPSGYEVQVSPDSGFATNETPLGVQLTEPAFKVFTLSSGKKFWRVRSHQGNASPETAAVTDWSTVRTFTVSSAPATPVSITPVRLPLHSGDDTWVTVQLSAEVAAGGAAISLESSNPDAAPVPATITMPGNSAITEFQMRAGQVASPTPVTLTATLNGQSASSQFTLQPSSLKTLTLTPTTTSGGVPAGGIMMLNGQAPAGGATVSLSSSSPAATPPATVTVPAGSYSTSFSIPTTDVTAKTPATLTASWNGTTLQSVLNVMPAPQPVSLSLFPATTVGGEGSVDGTVTIDSSATFDQYLRVSSNNPTVLPYLSSSVTIPAGSTRGFIQILTRAVTTSTVVTISVSGGGVTRSANLTVNPTGTPPPAPTLSSFTVSPTSVAGGTPATGTVTLPSAAPAGGTTVALGSNLPGAASVPASVLVPAGSTSASFTITTYPSATTTVQLSARLVDTTLFASLGVGPATASPAVSALTVSPTSVTGGSSATGTVTLTAAAPSGGAAVSLSDNSAAATTPASVTVPAGATSASFTAGTSSVTASTSATISAAYGGVTKTAVLTVNPPSTAPAAPSLLAPAQNGTPAQPVNFDWSDVSGAASYRIQADDSDKFSAPLVVDRIVTASQLGVGSFAATRHWWRVQALNSAGTAGAWSTVRRFTPQAAATALTISSVTLSPTTVVGGSSVQGTATLTGAAPAAGAVVTLATSNAAATVPASVTVAGGGSSATFAIATSSVAASTSVTISGAYGGVTRSAPLTVSPPAAAASLSALSVNPASVVGGSASQGTVTLSAAAPTGGFSVTLSSSSTAATVPASVTIAQGAASASFPIATSAVTDSTAATVTSSAGGVTRTATLTVAPQTQSVTLSVSATGRSGERVTSSPAGINVAVGSTASATFASGTAITLTVSNGREAVWSGACSTGGGKAKSCTFTASANASVSASVQ